MFNYTKNKLGLSCAKPGQVLVARPADPSYVQCGLLTYQIQPYNFRRGGWGWGVLNIVYILIMNPKVEIITRMMVLMGLIVKLSQSPA